MAKEDSQPSPSQSQPGLWQASLRLMAFVALALVLAFSTWTIERRNFAASRAVYLWIAILHALLTIALERAMSILPLAPGWRYRLAFLLSASLYLPSLGITHFSNAAWAALGLALSGAFLGGLIATSLNGHLWENNSPPTEAVRREVYQRHLEIIGRPTPTPAPKRLFDFTLALFGILISTPLWLLSAFLIWIEDPGPILFIKNSVGKGGVNFHQYKFRTMVRGAENATGPIPASEDDQRVLFIGRLLRKTALDELPQLINILRGEMSFVGPRPQRTVLVHGYLQKMPEYAERHRVLPGLAGLAQVAGHYYLTPRQKLRFDRLYILHSSLGFDLKLIVLAFMLTFWYRWQRGWNGRLPLKLLKWGSRRPKSSKASPGLRVFS
jgi:lipopolysaccharide/colanic/teichoic acid biosynthesis glycosyltransferase